MEEYSKRTPDKRINQPPKFVSGVDGLRSLAVIGVIIYHLLPNIMKGGFLGVPLFLLITGYFVTNQLTRRWQMGQPIQFRSFYWRRFKRLYPPLIGMLLVTSAYITLFAREALVHLRVIVLTNLTWIYNWWAIGHGQSYFDRFNGASPFTHLWTLGVEAQFYLVWPVILVWLLKRGGLKLTRWVTICLALLSMILMAVLYQPMNLNRVYYGTDTRSFSLLLGSWLALVWPREQLKVELPAKERYLLNGGGAISLILLIISFFTINGEAASTYYGLMALDSLIGLMLLATIVHPGAQVNQWLTNPVFHYLGQRSYEIYNFQLPVMVFYERLFPVGNAPWLNAIIELGLVFGISELAYRLVELPLKKQSLRVWLRKRPQTKKQWTSLVTMGTVVVIAGVGILGPQPQPAKSSLQKQLQHNKQATAARNKQIVAGKAPKVDVNSPSLKQKYQLNAKQLKQAGDWQVTAVGDSVMVDAANDLQEVMPHAVVNAKVGMQGAEGLKILKDLASKNQLSPIVVVNLGTNGAMSDQVADEIVQTVGNRQLYWITPHVPTRPWQQTVINQIKREAKQHSNVHVVNWNAKSKKHNKWFGKDKVHMNAIGNAQFTRLLVTTIIKEGK